MSVSPADASLLPPLCSKKCGPAKMGIGALQTCGFADAGIVGGNTTLDMHSGAVVTPWNVGMAADDPINVRHGR